MSQIDEENIYDYDAYLEKKAETEVKTVQGDAPKYLVKLIETANQRRAEQEEAAARLAAEQHSEKQKSLEVQKFFTSAYRDHLSHSVLSKQGQTPATDDSALLQKKRIKLEPEAPKSATLSSTTGVSSSPTISSLSPPSLPTPFSPKKLEVPQPTSDKSLSDVMAMKLKVFGDEDDEERIRRQRDRETRFVERASHRRNDEVAIEAAKRRYFERQRAKKGKLS